MLKLLDRDRVHTPLNRGIGEVSLESARASIEIVLAPHDWLTTTGARLDFPT